MRKTLLLALIALSIGAQAQEIQTVFGGGGAYGGYGVLRNKFTTIDGQFANFNEIYGGVFVNHKFMLGIGGGATTNHIRVPESERFIDSEGLSYGYGQFGLMTEFVVASSKAIHVTFELMAGPGFTYQYHRYPWDNYDTNYEWRDHEFKWATVIEPGAQVELNLLRWMRFSTGVSYRKVIDSHSDYLTDSKLSGLSLNVGLKFGKF